MYRTLQVLLVATHRTFLLAVAIIAGIFIFRELEHTTYAEAGLFCWSLATTTGFGNIAPITDNGKIFTIVYIFVILPTAIFCLCSYGSVLSHILQKFFEFIERCRGHRRVANRHLKAFLVLLVFLAAEIFAWAYALVEFEDCRYLDALYSWVTTVFTIGFVDSYPKHEPGNTYLSFGLTCLIHIVSLVTITSIIQNIQGMTDSIDNNKRRFCAMLFCCYTSDKRNIYSISNKDGLDMDYVV